MKDMVVIPFRPRTAVSATSAGEPVDDSQGCTLRAVARYVCRRWKDAYDVMDGSFTDSSESGPYCVLVGKNWGDNQDLPTLIERALVDPKSKSRLLGREPWPGFGIVADITENLGVMLHYSDGRPLQIVALDPTTAAQRYGLSHIDAEALLRYTKIVPSLLAASSDSQYQRNLTRGFFPFVLVRCVDGALERVAQEFLRNQGVLRSLSSTEGVPLVITLTDSQYQKALNLQEKNLPCTYRLYEHAEFSGNLHERISQLRI